MTFTVRSNSFSDGDNLANAHILSADFGFGCQGSNQSPHLAWSGAPTGTKSFAITCFDPDAPTGSGFWHWLVVNIPPSVTELAVDAGNPKSPKLPQGALQTRWHSWLWWSMSPGGRSSAPVSVHAICGWGRPVAGDGGYLAGRHWISTPF